MGDPYRQTERMPLDRVRDRYLHDNTFHTFVDMFRRAIQEMQLTPSEVREAAMLACLIEEERKPLTWPVPE